MRLLTILALLAFTLAAQSGPTVVKVDGDGHKLVLFSDGAVGGWGDTRDGQLGPRAAISNTSGHSTVFVPIALPGKAVDIAAGERTSYVLLDNGTVLAFGYGNYGQLGCGERCLGGSETPVPVSGLTNVTSISARMSTAYAVHRDGSVSTWGVSHLDSQPRLFSPARVTNLPPMSQVSAGQGFALGLSTAGRVWMWGKIAYGIIYTDDPVRPAAEVAGLTGVTAVVATRVAAALKSDGTVWVWGNNTQGQFGNGRDDSAEKSLVPLRVAGIANAVALTGASTGRHFFALLKDGSLRAWGNNDWGQIGNGISGQRQNTVTTPRITQVKAIFAAGNHSVAVRQDNSLWVWGAGSHFRGEWPLQKQANLPVRLAIPQGIVTP